MFVPSEIKIAIKNLTDFMSEKGISGGDQNRAEIGNEAVRLLREVWEVREQIPISLVSETDYSTFEQRNRGIQDQRVAEEIRLANRLVANSVDKGVAGFNVWEPRFDKKATHASRIGYIVKRVITRLELTVDNLEADPPEDGHRYIVKLDLDPMDGWEIFTDEVRDLTPDQKAALANLVRHQGLPGDTAEGIFYSLCMEVENYPPEDYINLGAIVGLFYAVWLRLREDLTVADFDDI